METDADQSAQSGRQTLSEAFELLPDGGNACLRRFLGHSTFT
ncbi:hypothetical protein THTE_3296 [Thermogutta terrifontis]|uniref:Uncharacterized protein n=1 Tax=Thermogutta terrifontis TaxID=1331910 RepID=A0A286RIW4_9BACT|nr:hypothetical protein THTE_3296 [Thermogutta terrifontis]